MKFTLNNNRQSFDGNLILLNADEIKINDYISTNRHDKDNKLEVFFKIEEIKEWGLHPKVFMTKDEQYVIVPNDDKYRIIRLDKE